MSISEVDEICFKGRTSIKIHKPRKAATTSSSDLTSTTCSSLGVSCHLDNDDAEENHDNNHRCRRVTVEYDHKKTASESSMTNGRLSNVLLQILNVIEEHDDDDADYHHEQNISILTNQVENNEFFTRENMNRINTIIMEHCHEEEMEEEEEIRLPFDLLNRLFPNFHGSLTIANSPYLTSSHLDDLLTNDFGRNVTHLTFVNCPKLTCLGFLSKALPSQPTLSPGGGRFSQRIHLESLSISNCGLVASSTYTYNHATQNRTQNQKQNDSTNHTTFLDPLYHDAMEAWSMTTTSTDIELSIDNCPGIQCFPMSIIDHLQDKLSILTLRHLPNLKRLPPEIGQLQRLKLLVIEKTGITHLPLEIGRLNYDQCHVAILDGSKSHINNNLPIMKSPPKEYRGSIQAMQRYFTIQRIQICRGWVWLYLLFRRARLRALERLYQPGGRGYKRCRDRFYRSMSESVSESVSVDVDVDTTCTTTTAKRCKH